MDETLIWLGDSIKAIGDGKIAGYLIRFGNAQDTDLTGDYFPPDVDIDYYEGKRISLLYNHGMDPVLKTRRLGYATLRKDDVGWWLEGQLAMRDEYERAIYEDMICAGKTGYSSGSAPHLVVRKAVGKAHEIKEWPVIEASITPTPAEFRNNAVPLKSLFAEEDLRERAAANGEAAPAPPSTQPVKMKTGSELYKEQLAVNEVQCWRLYDALQHVIAEIAEAARAGQKLGDGSMALDIDSLVTGAVNAFAELLSQSAVNQVREYAAGEHDSNSVSINNDHFYLRSLPPVGLSQLLASRNAVTRPGSEVVKHSDWMVSVIAEFANVADEVLGDLKTYQKRVEDKAQFRAVKDGRMLSKATLTKMGEACGKIMEARNGLDACHAHLTSLMEAAQPKPAEELPGEVVGQKTADQEAALAAAAAERARKMRWNYMRTEAERMGITAAAA